MTTSVRAFVDAARAATAEEFPRIIAELTALARVLVDADEDSAGAIELAEHLLLAHLGDADALDRWLQDLPPTLASSLPTSSAVARARWALIVVRDTPAQAPLPTAEARMLALQNIVLALAWQGHWERADRLLVPAETEALEAPGLPVCSAYAASANNIALHLRQLLPRSASRNVLMLDAATSARRAWERAGTWLQIERAEYQLAMCLAAADRAPEALRHASLCIDWCRSENAEANEWFFAHEALARAHAAALDLQAARAQREQMLALMPQLDQSLRASAERALAELMLD